MSETINYTSSFPNNGSLPYVGSYTVAASLGRVFSIIIPISAPSWSMTPPTMGPCAGNGLALIQQHVWSDFDFSTENFIGGVHFNFSTSRVYQDATLTPQTPQWILFGPGKSSYYAISVPNSPNLSLQIDIKRHNSSFPLPSKLFEWLSLATEKKCLNPGSQVGVDVPGVIESFEFQDIADPQDLLSHMFAAAIPANSLVFITLYSNLDMTVNATLDRLYSISASFVTKSSPPPPTWNIGTVLGVIFGIVIVIAALGVGYYLYKKRVAEYNRLN